MEKLPEGFVLDEDTNAQSSALPEGFVLDADPMENMGALEKGFKATQYGTAQRVMGVGKTIEALGGKGFGKGVQLFSRVLAPHDYRSASVDFHDPLEKDKGIGGFGWGYAPRAMLEGAPGLALDLSADAVAGPLGFVASNAAGSFGPTLDARVKNNGGKGIEDAGATDYAAAGAGTLANAVINRVGVAGGKVPFTNITIPGALNSEVKGAGLKALAQVPLNLAKAAGVDAASGAASTAVDQAATQIGTKAGYDPNLHEIVGNAALSGATGAVIRGARIPGDVINSVRDRVYDPQSATRVGDYVKTVDEKLGTEKGEYNALKTTKSHFEGQFTEARKNANEYIKEQQAGGFIKELDNRLQNGYTLRNEDYDHLHNLFNERQDGIDLVNAIKDRDTVNRLTSRGVMSHGEQRFGGGLSGGKLGKFINPTRALGRTLATVGGGASAAGQLSMPFMSQLGVMTPLVLKALGAQTGAYVASRGVDSILGTSHPVKRFANRWSGAEPTDVPNLPSTQDLKAAQKALAKLQAEEDRSFAAAEKGGTGRNTPSPERQAKQTDKAWQQHQKQQQAQESAQEARRAQEDAAWSDHTALPKDASEDALWAKYEANRQAEEAAPLEKSVDADARNAIQTSTQARDALVKAIAEAQPKQVVDFSVRPVVDKAAERAMRKLEEAKQRDARKKGREDLTNATSAFNYAAKELKKNGGIESLVSMKDEATTELTPSAKKKKKAKEALEKLQKVEQAAKNPKPAEMPDVQPTKGSKKLSDKALEKVQAAQGIEADGDYFVTRRGVQEARIPKGEITHSAGRWAARTQQRFEVRENFVNDLKKIGGESFKDAATTLLSRLSNKAKSWDEAYSYIEDFVNEPKHERMANEIWDVFNKHLPKLEGTYD